MQYILPFRSHDEEGLSTLIREFAKDKRLNVHTIAIGYDTDKIHQDYNYFAIVVFEDNVGVANSTDGVRSLPSDFKS